MIMTGVQQPQTKTSWILHLIMNIHIQLYGQAKSRQMTAPSAYNRSSRIKIAKFHYCWWQSLSMDGGSPRLDDCYCLLSIEISYRNTSHTHVVTQVKTHMHVLQVTRKIDYNILSLTRRQRNVANFNTWDPMCNGAASTQTEALWWEIDAEEFTAHDSLDSWSCPT